MSPSLNPSSQTRHPLEPVTHSVLAVKLNLSSPHHFFARLTHSRGITVSLTLSFAVSLLSLVHSECSFSRTAVNFSARSQSSISNIVMAVTVILCLELFTRLLYYTPMAILASIILSAFPRLIDIREACYIWKVDKVDFLACIGAFFGVLFVSAETGLIVACSCW